MLMMTAVLSSNRTTGMMNVHAKINLDTNVAMVACQISLWLCFASASSDMWMPNASDNESAIAIINMPPMTIIFDPVVAYSPINRPNVVIMPDASPKLKPFAIE